MPTGSVTLNVSVCPDGDKPVTFAVGVVPRKFSTAYVRPGVMAESDVTDVEIF